MSDIRITMRQLTETARDLHQREKALSLESVLLIGRLERLNAAVNLGLTSEAFARLVGLTPNVYWKRAQAARVIHAFPEAETMIRDGATEISHLALVAAKITEANSETLLSGIKDKTRREVEQLLSVITPDGRILDKEPQVELRLTVTKSQLALIERAREVLAFGGKVPSTAEILVKAVGDLLERRDPMVAAEKAARRKAAAPSPEQVRVAATEDPARAKVASPEKARTAAADAEGCHSSTTPPPSEKRSTVRKPRAAVPASVVHQVWLRDQGQCTEKLADGSRCPERMMLEVDHIVPVCRGGEDTVENSVLRCRGHNQGRARRELGAKYMVTWAESRARSGAAQVAP